ncbi:MAG: toxin-antitoxin system, toxin component, PIN family protein [Deltaproteobacteria bacterium]|nr:toxin-antitoxin system, toxin component, PIN family protein [Deltaproteobacteria bacterium]
MADSCLPSVAVEHLRLLGFEVEWSAEWPEDPGDEEIMERALAERRVLVTLDKDFGELAMARGRAHAGIVRLVRLASRQQGPACARALLRYGEELRGGALVTVEPGRTRIRVAD